MKVLDILKKAEVELREAIAEAACAGDYRTVDMGRAAAVTIQELCQRTSGNADPALSPVERRAERMGKRKGRKSHSRSKPAGLPRFEVRNGSLFRIGWSRKQRCEYSHKVPLAVFNAIAEAMASLAKGGSGPFAGEAVIAKLGATTEETIPAYQVYVVLGALREWGLITQVGREGYNILPDILEKAKQAWGDLVNR